jgi:hypothetical protein
MGVAARRAKLIVFMWLFSLCEARLSDPSRVTKTNRPRASRSPPTVSQQSIDFTADVTGLRFSKSTILTFVAQI